MESWREDIDRSRERRAGGSSQDNHAPLIDSAPVTRQAGGVLLHSIVDGAGGEQMTVAGQDEGASTAVTNNAIQDSRSQQDGVEAASAAVAPDSARPRKRGRSKGSTNKPKHGADATEASKPKSGRPKGSKNKPRAISEPARCSSAITRIFSGTFG
ncbi:hypothetical protein GN244_ATG14341 [Phytophthora infestans]|uniref:Uncharacterized protein n=1 Tax=Phytophthora infestans TaxID=4787 RepID=A0A833SFH0_PHYIN|nr:hypothetical protein GN244_ATG14341 [Phytophthora infestans]KAF4146097.1 hypothetical protein GN958_ATG04763 [Phytophthora infestans]